MQLHLKKQRIEKKRRSFFHKPTLTLALSFAFTLLETLIILLLSSIFLLIALPSYHQFVEKNQLQQIIETLVGALRLARVDAITSSSYIIFCPKNHHQCGTDWDKGQLLINESTHQILRTFSGLPVHYHIFWRSSFGESDRLRWGLDGFTEGQQGNFMICNERNKNLSSKIIVLRSGRLRTQIGNLKCNG